MPHKTKADRRAYARAWYRAHRAEVKEKARAYKKVNAAMVQEATTAYVAAHRDQLSASIRRRRGKHCAKLCPAYICRVLRMRVVDVPPELIQLKRAQLVAYRLVRILKGLSMTAPSERTLQALEDLRKIETTGDLRRLLCEAALALVRGEINPDSADALSRLAEGVNNNLTAEVRIIRTKIDLHEKGEEVGKLTHMGQLLIGR